MKEFQIYFIMGFFFLLVFVLMEDLNNKFNELKAEVEELRIECVQASESAKFAEQTAYNVINGVY